MKYMRFIMILIALALMMYFNAKSPGAQPSIGKRTGGRPIRAGHQPSHLKI